MNIFEMPKNKIEEPAEILGEEIAAKQQEDMTGKKNGKIINFEEERKKIEERDAEQLKEVRQEIAESGGEEKTKVEVAIERGKILEQIRNWQDFYQKVFGVELNVSELEIPEKLEGFDELIIMKEGLTAQEIFEKCQQFFDIRKRINNEETEEMSLNDIIKSDRNSNERAYAVWTPNDVEANAKHENISTEDIESGKVLTMTFEERLLLEMFYFLKTGNHLDNKMITLCAGSHFVKDGKVPGVTSFEGLHKVVIIVSEFLVNRTKNGNLDVRPVIVKDSQQAILSQAA